MKVINRIKDNNVFAFTVRKGRTLKTPSFVIHYTQNGLNVCRIGISVSKKLGNAVMRSRVKRQIRAMCDSLVNYSLHTVDVVLVVRSEFLNNDFHQNLEILKKSFNEIGITQ